MQLGRYPRIRLGHFPTPLEFLAADALAQGADTLITQGAVQSNHARQTVAAAMTWSPIPITWVTATACPRAA